MGETTKRAKTAKGGKGQLHNPRIILWARRQGCCPSPKGIHVTTHGSFRGQARTTQRAGGITTERTEDAEEGGVTTKKAKAAEEGKANSLTHGSFRGQARTSEGSGESTTERTEYTEEGWIPSLSHGSFRGPLEANHSQPYLGPCFPHRFCSAHTVKAGFRCRTAATTTTLNGTARGFGA